VNESSVPTAVSGAHLTVAVAFRFRLRCFVVATIIVASLACTEPLSAQAPDAGRDGLNTTQTSQLRSLGIKIAVPLAVPAGFHVEKVSVTPCPVAAHRSTTGTCRFGPAYAIVYRNTNDGCFAVEETGGGIGGVSYTYAFEVPTSSFGTVTVQFGQFTSARPQKPSSEQIASPQHGLFTEWAGGGPFYRVIGADWVRTTYYGEKRGKPAQLCRGEVTPALVAQIVKSLHWLGEGVKMTCFYDPSSPVPNPFGMRAYLTISGNDQSALATYESLPSRESYDPKVAVTVEERRQLRFYGTGVAGARRYLAGNTGAYHDLIGNDQPLMSYPAFDEHLKCKNAS
jgi:hypothetical protein